MTVGRWVLRGLPEGFTGGAFPHFSGGQSGTLLTTCAYAGAQDRPGGHARAGAAPERAPAREPGTAARHMPGRCPPRARPGRVRPGADRGVRVPVEATCGRERTARDRGFGGPGPRPGGSCRPPRRPAPAPPGPAEPGEEPCRSRRGAAEEWPNSARWFPPRGAPPRTDRTRPSAGVTGDGVGAGPGRSRRSRSGGEGGDRGDFRPIGRPRGEAPGGGPAAAGTVARDEVTPTRPIERPR